MYYTIKAIKEANKRAGSHFFDASAMRFFSSRVGSTVYQSSEEGRVLFITSEQYVDAHGRSAKRLYTVWEFRPITQRVEDASEFQQFQTLEQAKRWAMAELKHRPVRDLEMSVTYA